MTEKTRHIFWNWFCQRVASEQMRLLLELHLAASSVLWREQTAEQAMIFEFTSHRSTVISHGIELGSIYTRASIDNNQQ